MMIPISRSLSHEKDEVIYGFDSRVVDVDTLISRVARALPFLSGTTYTHTMCGARFERLHVMIVGSLAAPAGEHPFDRRERLLALTELNPHPNQLLSRKYMEAINYSFKQNDLVRLLDDLDIYEDFLNETAEEREQQNQLFQNTSLNCTNLKPTPSEIVISDIKAQVLNVRDNFLPSILNKILVKELTFAVQNCLDAIKAGEPVENVEYLCEKITGLLSQYNEDMGKRKAHSNIEEPNGKKARIDSESDEDCSSEEIEEAKHIRFDEEVYVDDLLKLSTAMLMIKEQIAIPFHNEIHFLAKTIALKDYPVFDEFFTKMSDTFSLKIRLNVTIHKSLPRVSRIMRSANLSVRAARHLNTLLEDKISQLNTLFKYRHSNGYTIDVSIKNLE